MDDSVEVTIMGTKAGYTLLTMTLDKVADTKLFAVTNYGFSPGGPASQAPRDALGASTSGIGSIADTDA
ncbi:MAG: hypothetical protein AB7D37_17845 [Desulfovibrio sp.]